MRVEIVVILDLRKLHEFVLTDLEVFGRVVHVGVIAQVFAKRGLSRMILCTGPLDVVRFKRQATVVDRQGALNRAEVVQIAQRLTLQVTNF